MKPAQDAPKMQLNLAKLQRNAGRDYNEYFMPRNIRMVLATTPKRNWMISPRATAECSATVLDSRQRHLFASR